VRAALTLAAAAAISLTALAGGAPALAEPVTETTVTTTAEMAPATTDSQAPVVTQAPVLTTQAPVVTEEPQIVTTTEGAPIPTPSAIVTTTATPIPTPSAIVTTTATPIPTPSAIVTTTATPIPTPSAIVTTTAPTPIPTPLAPVSTTAVPSSTASTTGTSQTTSQGGTSQSPTDAISTSGSERTGPTGSVSGGGTSGASSAEESAGVAKVADPVTLAAQPQDLKVAQQAVPVEQNPPPAPEAQVRQIRDLLVGQPAANTEPSLVAQDSPAAVERKVVLWQQTWVQYDEFYRPLIFNPFPEPLQVVYMLAGVPRILVIPPLGRIVTEVAQAGSYNFTALRLNAFGIPVDVAVGNFFGGGYVPGPGLPPPPPPPQVITKTNVPVQVKYPDATYKPIRVKKVVDVGPDPTVGEHKVLLDGVAPAWGEWKETETGERQFEVHKTQEFPGMEEPAEGPLPGDYPMQLVSDSSPTGMSVKDIVLIGSAVVVALLGLGAIVLTIFLGRRRSHQH
jgi:hypothetical protein